MFTVNGRFRDMKMTGVQRYAAEICRLLRSRHFLAYPQSHLTGLSGHTWEQTVLPWRSRGSLLWSPCNTGPVFAKRHIVTIHDIAPIEHPEWFTRAFSSLYNLLLPLLARRAEHIITVSEYTKGRLVNLLHVKEEKITVIPNGIGEEFTPQPQTEITRVRTRLNIPEGAYFLSVSSLEPRKNLGRLCAAWSKIQGQLGPATLVIAGAKGSSNIFRQSGWPIPESVVFTGYVPDKDLPALYSGATALIYPSLYEGFGLPVLEAAACGTLTITSNATALPEITDASAIMIDPFSESDLARAIEKAFCNPSTPRQRLAREQHARQYNWGHSADLTERVLLSHC
jgi:glycosyltransferase involved in cell wall biosynthesis